MVGSKFENQMENGREVESCRSMFNHDERSCNESLGTSLRETVYTMSAFVPLAVC